MAVTGVRLFGVVNLLGEEALNPSVEAQVIPFRELGAVVRQAPFARMRLSPDELGEYAAVVDAVFRSRTILPAPPGTLFRSGDLVIRWLDMNYVALWEGIHFVEGRCEARVHVRRRADAPDGEELAEADAAAIAADSFRAMRRHAAAALPLRGDHETDSLLSGAFLTERMRWTEFSEMVREQARRYEELRFEQTGPWPPYDFVRMDFGA